jgi:hypothetical protein
MTPFLAIIQNRTVRILLDVLLEERISSELVCLAPPPLNLLLPSRMFSSQLNPKLTVDYNKFSRENIQSKLSQLHIVLSIAHIVASIV